MTTKIVIIPVKKETKKREESIELQVKRKIASYIQQDKKHNRPTDDNITHEETLSKLNECKMLCYYCKMQMTREGKQQWTLDRIENHIPHTRNNVVISCLACNLRKRVHISEKYKYSMQLTDIKKLAE